MECYYPQNIHVAKLPKNHFSGLMNKLLILIGLLLSTPAIARINETREQCVKRYGVPIKKEGQYLLFKHNDFKILVAIRDSKVYLIKYSKIDKTKNLSSFEVDHIMKISSDGKWKLQEKSKQNSFWVNSDKSINALYSPSGLTISTVKSAKQDSKDTLKKQIKGIKGL